MNKRFIKTWIFAFACLSCSLSGTMIEIRGAAFFPASHRFRHIYGNVQSDAEIEASTEWNCSYDVWTNFSWLSKKNRNRPIAYGYSGSYETESGRLKSRIKLPNVSAGFKYTFPLPCMASNFKLYAGLGIILGRVYLDNRTHFMHEKTSKVAFGGVIKTGFNYFITRRVFLDFFADYIYQPVHFHRNINVGGLKVGGGLGMKF